MATQFAQKYPYLTRGGVKFRFEPATKAGSFFVQACDEGAQGGRTKFGRTYVGYLAPDGGRSFANDAPLVYKAAFNALDVTEVQREQDRLDGKEPALTGEIRDLEGSRDTEDEADEDKEQTPARLDNDEAARFAEDLRRSHEELTRQDDVLAEVERGTRLPEPRKLSSADAQRKLDTLTGLLLTATRLAEELRRDLEVS